MGMDWIWKTIAVFAIVALLDQVVRKRKNKRSPTGPKGLPILGHLHLLGKNPHQDLHELAKKHGPIMYMRFGLTPTIIVSSPQAAEQILKRYDQVFAGRPLIEASKYMSYGQRNFAMAPYGPYWRSMRKFCTLELLSNFKINSFESMRREELGLLVESLKQAAQERSIVDLSAKVSSLSADITCRMLFGKKYTDEDMGQRGFKAVMQETMELVAAPNLGDYFPYLGMLDIQGLTRKMKAISKLFDAFLEKIIEEHEQKRNQGQTKDFVDTMLAFMKSGEAEFRLDRSHVKANLLDIFGASLDTSAATIEWTLSELLKHPRVMKKAQEELKEIIGVNRMVEESDLDSLEYLNMVMKESFRLHPVAPLLLPHEAMEDCTVDGFDIAKKSRIIINVWAIGRDPNVWNDPEIFIPERFVGNNIDVRGRDFELIPFGSGKRSCPAMQLGVIVVQLVIAQLVHCFDWELPNDMMPTVLDMTEHFGLVVSRAKHLTVVPNYRLQI